MAAVGITPTGSVHVREQKKGRVYYAYWRDAAGRHGRLLGPAHVRDSGRRAGRGAVIWRAADGPKPSPAHLTPKEADAALRAIVDAAPRTLAAAPKPTTFQRAAEGWLAERIAEKGLKRSSVVGNRRMFGRLYRDLGEDTLVQRLGASQLSAYFRDFEAQRPVGRVRAEHERAAGGLVRTFEVPRWVAYPEKAAPQEVATKEEAVKLAAKLQGTWKHRRRGVYRVVPRGGVRPRRVTRSEADELKTKGWTIERRTTTFYAVCTPASAQTRNKYRDVCHAILAYAKRQGWVERNELEDVKRVNRKRDRQRVLRRTDFYDQDEVAAMLAEAPDLLTECFWLAGFHAGYRLPGEAQGLKWGAVDLVARVTRPYGNWVLNAEDDTKTVIMKSPAVPMTDLLEARLRELKQRAFRTDDDDFVFTANEIGRPVSERDMRTAFAAAARAAGLHSIRMYNSRHSFGTSLAREGIDVRTIQGLMRHEKLSTTEQYMAYAPQPDLAARMTRALSPTPEQTYDDDAIRRAAGGDAAARFFAELEEEIPAKWLAVVKRAVESSGLGIAAAA